jgi:hypothetical protein
MLCIPIDPLLIVKHTYLKSLAMDSGLIAAAPLQAIWGSKPGAKELSLRFTPKGLYSIGAPGMGAESEVKVLWGP